MKRSRDEPDIRDARVRPMAVDIRPNATRRDFLGRVGKRAAFIVPVVWTLTAQDAQAAGSNPSASPSCVPHGGLCAMDSDCCSGNCTGNECD